MIQAHEIRIGVEDDDLEVRLQQEAFEYHTQGKRLARTGLAAQEGMPVETLRPQRRAHPFVCVERPADVERRPPCGGEIPGHQISASRAEVCALKAILARRRYVPVILQFAQNDARAVGVAPLERVGVARREVNTLGQESVEAGIKFEADLCPLTDRYLLRDHLAEV